MATVTMQISRAMLHQGAKRAATTRFRDQSKRCTRHTCKAAAVNWKQGIQLVCPICQDTPLDAWPEAGRASTGGLTCGRCKRSFESDNKFVDLTLTSGLVDSKYTEKFWGGTELFRTSIVSAVYEQGWRQSFSWAGFPGADKEFEYAMDYIAPQFGETLVDMSCGSGLFTRRFAQSGKFDGVVAVDFSANMLKQTAKLMEEAGVDQDSVRLVRADVARLPFPTGSVAAIHAGAAMHCWPNPSAAMAEISRVLKPGGIFVASTFLNGFAPIGQLLGNDEALVPLAGLDVTQMLASQYKWWSEPELKDLSASVGLGNFARHRDNRFIMFSVQK